MTVRIFTLDEFERQARRMSKKYKSLKSDIVSLVEQLQKNPFRGQDLGGGVRKIHMAINSKGKGKSGGARVLTLNILVSGNADVTLLTIYDKSEMENVSDQYIESLVREEMK